MLSWSKGVASWFLKSEQGPASPGKAPGVERECNVSCVDAVRGCTDPVVGTCCWSHLQNDHGLDCLGPIRATRAGAGKGGMDQPVQAPWHGHKGNAWGHPYTSWFMSPRLVRRPVYVPWRGWFRIPFPQVPFEAFEGFEGFEAPFEGVSPPGGGGGRRVEGSKPSKGASRAWRGFKGLRSPWRGLQGLQGLEGGLKGAWRGASRASKGGSVPFLGPWASLCIYDALATQPSHESNKWFPRRFQHLQAQLETEAFLA